MLGPDRVFSMKATGKTDTTLTPKSKVHIICNPETMHWTFRYDAPAPLPLGLQNKVFTSLIKARTFAESYYAKRNIKIEEINGA